MNHRSYRLVFSKLRGMRVAVAETAVSQGKAAGRGETAGSFASACLTRLAMRHAAFAALALFSLMPVPSGAQIVPSGAHAPDVVNAANGVPQVNVQRPSGAGVSMNTYSQFDVQRNGAILNNSPVITNTQLAGQISGNPNFGPNDAARIIVNQVSSNNPSQLRGYVEVAGQRTAAVVVSNASGLVVDGGGFINTSRGILTTGHPLLDANGNLSGFNVTQGSIAVQGEGFNASNLDQADLIARAVQVNAAIYGDTLDVVSGANHVDYSSLNATPVAGSAGRGATSGVSIDVSQLGGMYANRITLVGTGHGVGVANAGTLAARAGDLTLTTSGQLVQSGRMSAGGNIAIEADIGVSVCVPPLCVGKSSVSGSFSQTKMNSDYAGVTGQSGIRAGEGGFQVNVAGNTDLKGGVIASSDEAVKSGVNSLTTGTLISRWVKEFAGLVVGNNGQTPPAEPNPLADAHDGTQPPATGGAVVTPAVVCTPNQGCAVAPGMATAGTPGYAPGNATLNNGSGEGQSASGQSGNSSDGKSTVVVDNARAGHIFRDSEGHLSDTAANRALLEQVANNPTAVAGTDKYGTVWSSSIQSDGTQVWVGVRDGKVSYGGVNQIPKEFNSQTGFSSPTKPGGTK